MYIGDTGVRGLHHYGRNRAITAAGGGQVAAAAAQYLALATALPTGPGTATLASFAAHELTTTGYSRQAVTWGTAVGGTIQNSGTVLFGAFGADPPGVPYVWECDTSVGAIGEVLAFWRIQDAGGTATTLDAANGDFIQISPADLKLTIDTC